MAVHLRRGLKMDSKIKKLCSRTVLFTAGKFISKILAVLLLPLYTNLLSTAEYSTADLLTNMANLLIPVVCLGINEGIFRSTAAKETDPAAVFSTGMGVFLCGEVVFLLLSPLLMFVDVVGSYWWLVVVYVLASDLHSICSQYICATGHERLYAGQGILNTALVVVLNILFLAVFRMGVVGYVLAVGLADFLTAPVPGVPSLSDQPHACRAVASVQCPTDSHDGFLVDHVGFGQIPGAAVAFPCGERFICGGVSDSHVASFLGDHFQRGMEAVNGGERGGYPRVRAAV